MALMSRIERSYYGLPKSAKIAKIRNEKTQIWSQRGLDEICGRKIRSFRQDLSEITFGFFRTLANFRNFRHFRRFWKTIAKLCKLCNFRSCVQIRDIPYVIGVMSVVSSSVLLLYRFRSYKFIYSVKITSVPFVFSYGTFQDNTRRYVMWIFWEQVLLNLFPDIFFPS